VFTKTESKLFKDLNHLFHNFYNVLSEFILHRFLFVGDLLLAYM